MDPLSDVLSLLKLRTYMCRGFDIGGPWSIQFARHDGIKCYAVISGRLWIVMDGEDPVRVEPGDCFLMPRGRPFRITSDPALTPADAETLVGAGREGAVNTVNGGGDYLGIGCYFALAGHQAEVLLGALPPIVHLRNEADKAALRWSLDRLMRELREPRPGGLLIAQHLACMILIQALRLHLAEGPRGGASWLFALADRQISASIAAMHEAPARRWTLRSLAERAGLSRTTFAVRFKETTGVSAMDYLARWRMLLAADRLETSAEAVGTIALSLGYDSESAFSTAFKRVMGCSPRQYGRGPPAPRSRGRNEVASFQPTRLETLGAGLGIADRGYQSDIG